MQYFISFLEGIITFVSPCLLPMLPIYISYFAGGSEKSSKKTVINTLGFISGFTVLFVAMGALAGSLGRLLREYNTIVNIVTGLIVICFGLNFLGVLKFNIFKGTKANKTQNLGFFSSFLFGVVFSIGWTPCVGAFLGSALMMASTKGEILKGSILLLCYSVGLGIPFILSSILIEKLKKVFTWIKEHYKIINTISFALYPNA